VFAPLGMKTARIISEADIVPHRAAGYQFAGKKLKNQDWVSPSLNTTADGALYVTIRDMVAWDQGIREGKVLSAEGWKQVFTPVTLNGGKTFPYGFGWQVDEERGQPHHHHNGAWQGFTTHISRYRTDDLSVIVLTNLAGCDPSGIAEQIAGLFNPKLGPKPPAKGEK
jgi:CubicO group peptidase (beta-lactamase class C family)